MSYKQGANGVWGDFYGFEARRCHQCGDLFHPRFEWAWTCFNCYLENQGETSPRERQHGRRHDSHQSRQNYQHSQHDQNHRDRQTFGAEESSGLPAALSPRQRKLLGEFETYLSRLIQLCHPDKHSSSQMANEVTQWLLSLREKRPGDKKR